MLLNKLRPIAIALTLIGAGSVYAAPVFAGPDFPARSGRVVDQANLLDSASELRLSDALAEHERATRNQVVVVTVASLQGLQIVDYGRHLGNHWGLGQAGRDNGLLLLVAPAERQVRLTIGRGLQASLSDSAAQAIIDNDILPSFHRGLQARGIERGVGAILATLEGRHTPVAPAGVTLSKEEAATMVVILVAGVFVLLAFVGVARYQRAERRRDLGNGPRYDPNHRAHYSHSGFSGGGGGGRFGGGGASGNW